jgi:hypothetical protein
MGRRKNVVGSGIAWRKCCQSSAFAEQLLKISKIVGQFDLAQSAPRRLAAV